MSNPRVLYILECTHVVPGNAGTVDTFCYTCGDLKKNVDVHEYEWRMMCKNCNYHPWCGLSQMLANYTANMHARKRDGHIAYAAYMCNPFARKIKERMML